MRDVRCEKTKADIVPLGFGWVLCWWGFFSSLSCFLPISWFQKINTLETRIELCFYFSKQDVQKQLKRCCWQIFIKVWSCKMGREKTEWPENYNKYFFKGGEIAKSRISMGALLSNCVLSWGGKRVTDQRWVEEAAEQLRHWTQVKRNRDRKCLERTGQR